MEDSVAAFLDHITLQRELSANTRAAYRNDLTQLTTFLRKWGADGWQVEASAMAAYVNDLMERGYSTSTRARKVAAVRTFYRYLCDQGIVQENPTADIVSTRVERNTPTILSHEQVKALFAAARRKSSPESLRDQSILQLLYSTGMRITEALGIDIDDVDAEQGRLILRSRQKEAVVPVTEECLAVMARYLAVSRPQLETSRSGAALYLNHRGQRLSRQGFWLVLKGYARAAGLPEVTPQTLRHTFTAHALESSVPLQRVRSTLGNTNTSATQRYARSEQDGASTNTETGGDERG